jgi:serine phosphatase RsbU (regulator of sigma subunit)
LVTDGITETFNPEAKPFGSSRLAEVFQKCRDVAVTELVKTIDEALSTHRAGGALTDDCTVVAIEFTARKDGKDVAMVPSGQQASRGLDGRPAD